MTEPTQESADPTKPSGETPSGGGAASLPGQLKTDAGRVRRGDIQSIKPSARERELLQALTQHQVDDRVTQYLSWRGSALRIAAATGVAALVFILIKMGNSISDANELARKGKENQLTWGTDVLIVLSVLPVLAQAGLVATLLLAAKRWTTPGWTAVMVRRAWLVALLVPAGLTLVPVMSLLLPEQVQDVMGKFRFEDLTNIQASSLTPDQIFQVLLLQAFVVVVALNVFFSAIPAVLSLFPGVLRASLMVKLLLPGRGMSATVGGLAAPFYALLLVVVLSLFQQLVGSMLSLIGAIALVVGLLLFARGLWSLSRPMDADEARAAVAGLKKKLFYFLVPGVLVLLITLFTRRIFGMAVMGFGEDAMFQPWDLTGLVLWFITMTLTYSVVACDGMVRVMRVMDRQIEIRRTSEEAATEKPLVTALDALLTVEAAPEGAADGSKDAAASKEDA